jgi:hypothetical protein
VYLVIYCLILLLIPALFFISKKIKKVKIFYDWLKQKMLWNATFSFVLKQYPAIILASGINLYGLSFKEKDSGKVASSVIALLLMIGFTLVIPIFSIIVHKLKKRDPTMNKDDFASLFDGYDIERPSSNLSWYWNIIVLLRWFVTNAILIILKDSNLA